MKANILRMFDHGDYIHQLIMKSLLSTRELHVVASEVNIPPQELISGRADAIISNGKELHVLDIKSMNSMIFRNLQQPKEENVNQIQLYLHYFKIKKGILLYVNKDTQELKEFVVNYNKTQVQSLLSELADLKIKINSNTVPSRISNWPSDWQCKYCQFKGLCRMADDGGIKWEDFKKEIERLTLKES